MGQPKVLSVDCEEVGLKVLYVPWSQTVDCFKNWAE